MTSIMRILSLLVLIFAGPFFFGGAFPAEADEHPDAPHSDQKTGTVWTCSMHPQIQLPHPGQCPICFMDLIEVHLDRDAENRTNLRQITFDEEARRLAQVDVAPVVRGNADSRIRMVGKVDYDETRLGTITAWMAGRIDKLFVSYTGSVVRQGQPMARVYSPELLTAQAELIQAATFLKKSRNSGNELIRSASSRTEKAAREKLRLLGLTEQQVDQVAASGEPSDYVILTAPMSGIVIKKDVTEGVYVKTGSPIYTIADFNHLWVVLEAYESDLYGLHLGQKVTFSVEAFPGRTFVGEVVYIDPLVDEKTRTVRVRLNVANAKGQLKPGMFVRAVASSFVGNDGSDAPLLIPASAPLFTGKRALVYVQQPDREGVYEGREIILGPRRGEFYQVVNGLREGELVVVRGNFKIDSAIQIQARPSMMNPFRAEQKTPAEIVPALFSSRLQLLNHTFTRLSESVAKGSSPQVGQDLDSFAAILAKIQPDEPEKEGRLAWKELTMLLNGDVVLVREAENEKELQRLFQGMKEHFTQVQVRFDLHETTQLFAGSEELRTYLAKALKDYLQLQQDLAADEEKKAGADSPMLVTSAQNVIEELKRSGHPSAAPIGADLEKAVQQLRGATSLAAIRTAFYPFSKSIGQAIATFGVPTAGPLYEQFCPMAFDNTGATWLAGTEEINNPYFGAAMLHCGEVRRQLKE